MLDLEHADFHKTLESDRAPPKSDNHNNSNYSDVKDFDGNSYVCMYKYNIIFTCIYIIKHNII